MPSLFGGDEEGFLDENSCVEWIKALKRCIGQLQHAEKNISIQLWRMSKASDGRGMHVVVAGCTRGIGRGLLEHYAREHQAYHEVFLSASSRPAA